MLSWSSTATGQQVDLAAVAAGAGEVIFNGDRAEQLAADAAGVDPAAALRGVELVGDTRRRLDLNVAEELALEALFFRLQATLTGSAAPV